MTEKFPVFITIDCMTALAPVTLSVYPPTDIFVLVVSVTSLKAAKVNVGKNNSPRNKILSFFVNLFFIF